MDKLKIFIQLIREISLIKRILVGAKSNLQAMKPMRV